MPTRQKQDSKGSYYQWGDHGKKYYYDNTSERSRQTAQKKANKQGQAIKASQARHFKRGGGEDVYYEKYKEYKLKYLELKNS
jgi:hypothetical protein